MRHVKSRSGHSSLCVFAPFRETSYVLNECCTSNRLVFPQRRKERKGDLKRVEEIQISGSRHDQSFQDTSRGNVRKRFIGVREIVAREICLQSRPRRGAARVGDDLRAAVKVRKIGTPAAAYVQM